MVIEDDAYGMLEPAVSPIANLIPERTYLAVGLSKCIAPALRVSYLLVPDAAAELLFQVIAGRAERAAVIITTNLPFSEWTTMLDLIEPLVEKRDIGFVRLDGRWLL